MCDLLDCRNCKHKCKNDLNDNEIEDLWREWEDVAFVESEDKKLILANDWRVWSKGTCSEDIWKWIDEHYSKGIRFLYENF